MRTYITHTMKSFMAWLCFMGAVPVVQAQDLQTLIQLGLQDNPSINQANLRYQLASEQVNEVHVLPNTEFGLGYFVSEPETRTGPQKFKVSINQMLPWFGSITARENYATSLADAEYEKIAIAQRQLVMSISQSYYELWANQLQQDVLESQKEILDHYKTLALSSIEVGQATAVDVLKLEMRANDISEQITVLKQAYLAVQTEINMDLNRERTIPITVNSDLKILENEKRDTAEITNLHPELLQYDKLYESVEQSDLLNQKARAPMIGFGLDYIAIEKRQEPAVDNGKDVIMPMLSVSIPVFNSKYKSISVQNKIQKDTYLEQKVEKRNTLIVLLDAAEKDRNVAEIRFKTQTKNIEQAKYAQDLLLKSYETGIIDFNDVLDVQELQLKYEVSRISSIKSYYQAQTRINYLTQ